MNRTRTVFLAGALLLATLGLPSLQAPGAQARAETGNAAAAPGNVDFGAVASRIRQEFPELEVNAVRQSPMPGLLEVVSGHHVFYSDLTGGYLINGRLIDARNKIDLTEAAIQDLNRIDPKILPLADSFAEIRGNGKRQLYVFSDPDCPYCRKLENEFPKLNDVTIHVFPYPLESIHPNSRANAVALWCAKDRVKAWSEKMRSGAVPSSPSCDNPVDRNVALGEKLGFTGTPTIIYADGRVSAGARPAEDIERQMGAPD